MATRTPERMEFETRSIADGVSLHLCPTRRFKTVTLKLVVQSHLGPETTGTALVPYVLRRGCRRTPTQRRIVLFLESLYGATLGVDVLKVGEHQLPQFRLDLLAETYARNRQGTLARGLDFLFRLLLHPVTEGDGFRAAVVSSEGENLRHFIEGLVNDPVEYANERLIEVMCEGEPFARYEYGRIDEINRWDARSLLAHQRMLLERSPIHLFAVGDFDPERLARHAARALRLKRHPAGPPPRTLVSAPQREPRRVMERLPELEQGKLNLGFRTGVTLTEPGMAALAMMNGLFGGLGHSRLFRHLREEEGLAYHVHTSLEKTKGLLLLSAGVPLDAVEKARAVIDAQLDSLRRGDITEDEMNMTRQSLRARIRAMGDSPVRLINAHLEGILNGRPVPPAEREESLDHVRAEDVARAAARLRLDTEYVLLSEEAA